MHIENNIYDNMVGTTLPIERKAKDTTKTRIGLQVMGIRSNLPSMMNTRKRMPIILSNWMTKKSLEVATSCEISRLVH